jgi:hypothetical protein
MAGSGEAETAGAPVAPAARPDAAAAPPRAIGDAALPTELSLNDYVARLGGVRVLRHILIANNGIAAVKAIRSIRRWA